RFLYVEPILNQQACPQQESSRRVRRPGQFLRAWIVIKKEHERRVRGAQEKRDGSEPTGFRCRRNRPRRGVPRHDPKVCPESQLSYCRGGGYRCRDHATVPQGLSGGGVL